MKRIVWCLLSVAMLLLCGCGGMKADADAGSSEDLQYTQITQEEAARIMTEETGYLIVDVRTQEEYDEGHIPGAICVPNEQIENTLPETLPDLGQPLLVYCRSGRRSKEAARKLSAMGYTNVYEFGGINTWTGEIVP